MSSSCTYEGCTVDETGICALSRDSLTCENRVNSKETGKASADTNGSGKVTSQLGDQLGAPVLNNPSRASAFPSSRTLGLDDLNALMDTRYVSVVGILGDPESGKTACLASLYLLVSHAKLTGWSFADSKSLSGFEEIALGARDWNEGRIPDQMTVHTELSDDRNPGFLHLRLKRDSDGRRVDLALPDVPGEWTQALVSTARSDRFEFIKSADAIWIVVDGRILADIEKRLGLIARVGQLVERLTTLVGGRTTRFVVVVTHHDTHVLTDFAASRLQKEFTRRAVQAKIVGVAPFSDDPENVPPGFGIAELIDLTVGELAKRPIFWNSTHPTENARAYLAYRRDR